jgi:hypothetical protein
MGAALAIELWRAAGLIQASPERLGGIGVLIGVLDELGAMHDFPHYPHASLT